MQLKSSSKEDQLIFPEFEESVWAEVRLRDRDKLLLGCIYRSPNADEENNNKLLEMLEAVQQLKLTHLLLVGDFNCKIKWDTLIAKQGEKKISVDIVESISAQGWTQHVKLDTHFREGQRSILLDLVITNEPHMVEDLEILNPLGKSDHGLLSFTYLCYGEERTTKGILKYYKGVYKGMREYLSQQNREFEVNRDVNVTWKRFHSAIMTAMKKIHPLLQTRL